MVLNNTINSVPIPYFARVHPDLLFCQVFLIESYCSCHIRLPCGDNDFLIFKRRRAGSALQHLVKGCVSSYLHHGYHPATSVGSSLRAPLYYAGKITTHYVRGMHVINWELIVELQVLRSESTRADASWANAWCLWTVNGVYRPSQGNMNKGRKLINHYAAFDNDVSFLSGYLGQLFLSIRPAHGSNQPAKASNRTLFKVIAQLISCQIRPWVHADTSKSPWQCCCPHWDETLLFGLLGQVRAQCFLACVSQTINNMFFTLAVKDLCCSIL